ncbi:hypothetical protein DFH29DRAFT_982811 [Suillus ampliporus]|nr:hypothetical protein DFH29DRAFT_982811 [Suillus ampliporus]
MGGGLENTDEAFMPAQGVQLGPLFQMFHPHLTDLTHSTGCKCDVHGNNIDQNVPPPPQTEASPTNWTPYESRVAFEAAEFLYMRNQMSAGQIDTLLDLWAATLIKHQDSPPFTGHQDLYETIDSTPLGDLTWETFSMSYNGVKPADNVPPWMTAKYDVWFHDLCLLVHHMLSNPDFATETEYDKCCYKNFFSGDWAWKQADIIVEDPETHGSTFVSVATGHTEYHPLYLLIGNIFNGVRRAHRNGVVLVGFLAIPKSTKEHLEDKDFRNFRRQMFHSSLTKIFDSMKPNMTVPDVVRCPDSHFRHVIYGLGPYIADYPEQLVLSGVVQNWCPKYVFFCLFIDLHSRWPSLLRCREHTDLLVQELEHAHLWYEYGIVQEVVPFTNDFPRADIHELLSPDLLHQIIKGTFKDHLVDWVEEYFAAEIMDDIDRRYSNKIAAVAPFAGLQCFPEGHGFKQWTGDDSKALMKVYLPAIKGHIPWDVVRAFSAFLDFCYIVRRDTITEDDLIQLQDALNRFHQYHKIFKTTGVVLGFSFPHQHSLNHYSLMIRLYWRPKRPLFINNGYRSNKYKALGQMLLTNQRLDKIAAALRNPDIIDGPTVQAHVELAATPVLGGARDVSALAPPDFDPVTAPAFMGRVSVFSSAAASFYAPSDLSVQPGGMRCEHIRSNNLMVRGMNNEVNCGLDGLAIARVLHFLSFKYRKYLQCAVVHWFAYITDSRDPDTGMYLVAPSSNDDGTPDISIIHIDCIFRAAHLVPLYGANFLPREIGPHDSYNVFRAFYVNKYADHHSFEVA